MANDITSNKTFSRWAVYRFGLKQTFVFWLSLILAFSLERFLMLNHFVSENITQQYRDDITPMFLKGLLFDIKASSLLSAVAFLLLLISLIHPTLARVYQKIHKKLLTLLFVISIAFALGNWFYFSVYEKQFDVFVFGLFDEDTNAVVKTIWSNYPVVSGSLALLVLGGLFAWLLNKLPRVNQQAAAPLWLWVAGIVLPLLALTLGIRGSVGKFPLRQTAMQISAAPQLNKLVPNALISLDWARKEYRNSSRFEAVSDADGSRILSQLLETEATADLQQLVKNTPTNPAVAQKKPNVVLAVMESMSSHLLDFDNAERNLLGRLKPHWQSDWVYKKFISEGDGTSDTLHRLFVRSPRLDLSQSTAKNKTFISNMFKPYADAGYRIVYLTAGNGGWRDFDTFLRHLGVDEIIDENGLKDRFPEAKSSTWGIPDEYMFRYAEELLQKAGQQKQPVFIMMLSVTNHPPYRLPDTQQSVDFRLTESESGRLKALAQGKELNEIFNTFRYSNDQLGSFIANVKQTTPDTIIAVTGDHNMRAIGYPEANEVALGHGVPFYLYVPEKYRHQAVYQPERAGSHKDVLPTLYHLSLSETPYYNTGCNLTAPQADSPWCGYGYNKEVLITENGFYHLHNQKFHPWSKAQGDLHADSPTQPNEHDLKHIKKGSVYTEFLEWQINRIVTAQ